MQLPPSFPPPVTIDLQANARAYWMARAAQHTSDSYAGVPISKFPEDLRVYEHLMWDSAANVVIELGSYHGGSALWFRDRLATMHSYNRITAPYLVISVDIDISTAQRNVANAGAAHDDIVFVEGDVTDPSNVERVEHLLPENAHCLVVEDSAHVYETTMAALNGYAKFVPPGGYFVVEDGCVDIDEMRLTPNWPKGVLPALDEWLAGPNNDGLVNRRDLELYGLTCHPRGFLQRETS